MKRSKVTATSFATVTNLIAVLSPLAGLAASLAVTLPARGGDVVFTKRVITEDLDGRGGDPGFADSPGSVFATDVDGDGDIDVLSASKDDNKIAWYENDGGSPPTFTPHVISTAADGAATVFATDVDGDGHTDVLSASFLDDKIAWYENDGGSPPSFTEHVISTAADRAVSVFATDLDGDGDTDVLSASIFDDKIAWYENDGGAPPTFTERVISTNADNASSVFATDMDGDGDTDVLSASFRDDKIAWYENDGGSPPTFTERAISITAIGARSVFALDVDGDGDIDVLAASQLDHKIAWYEGDGGSPPTFTERVISTAAASPVSVFATDVDGDADIDVLSASTSGKIVWYESDGGSPPIFTEHVISAGETSFRSVFATDLDADGDTDVLTTTYNDDEIAWWQNTTCADAADEITAPDSLSHADQSKNRFLSIVPGNENRQTALRVTLTSSSTFPGDVGMQWWVGTPREMCENSGQGAAPAFGCGPAPGIPGKDMWSSQLVCDQECHDWHSFVRPHFSPLDVLHISDPDIVPGSVYEIQAVHCQCDPLEPSNYSTPVPVATSKWGDTVGLSIAGCPVSGPNGPPISLILDCVSIINKFSNLPCAPLKSRVDLDPSNPNLIITISDVVACLGGFRGEPYPYPAPVGCP